MKKLLCFICLILCVTGIKLPVNAENSQIVFHKNQEKKNKIALTFDDGPHPRYTPQILDILDRYNVKATFFVIGKNLENYPSVLKRVYESGHEIGNHSYDHTNEKHFDESKITFEIEKCEELICEQIGVKPNLFRPPQGDYNLYSEKIASQKEYSIILWSIDTRDWEHLSPNKIMSVIDRQLVGGDIILMHDYTSGKNTTCDALEIIIPTLLSKGYEFVTVSELIK